MNICIVYYTKTGRTRKVVEFIERSLSSGGFSVKTFLIRPLREYEDRFLHFNPRVLIHAISGRVVEIAGDEEFNPGECNALILATPIWYNKPTPPILSFAIKYSGQVRAPVYCVTTSALKINYYKTFKEVLESLGYNVVGGLTVSNLDRQKEEIAKLTRQIEQMLKHN